MKKVPKTHSRKLISIILLLVVAFAILISIGLRRYQSTRPDRILTDAVTQGLRLASSERTTSGNLLITYVLAGNNIVKEVNISLKEVPNASTFESDGQLNLKLAAQDISVPATVRATSGKLYIQLHQIDTSVKQISKTVPVFGLYSDYVSQLAKRYNDKWIALGDSQLESGALIISQPCLSALGGIKLSTADQQQLVDIYQHPPLFKTISSVGEDDIAGQASYHLVIAGVDTAKAASVGQILGLDSFKAVSAACKEEIKSISTEMLNKKSTQSLSTLSAEAWVSKKTRQFTKVSLPVTGGTLSLQVSPSTTVKSGGIGKKITEPSDSVPMQRVQSDIETILGAPL